MLLPSARAATTAVNLELVDAQFFGGYVAGTIYLRESSTGLPVVDKQVAIMLSTDNRDASGWVHFRTTTNGAVHVFMPRLWNTQKHEFYTNCQFDAEFNIKRLSSDPTRELYPEYGYNSVHQTMPYVSSGSPIALMSAPIQNGVSVPSNSVQHNIAVRFESLSYASDSASNAPNYHIDDWYWTITSASSITTDNGPAINFMPTQTGLHTNQLVVWDYKGRVGALTNTFMVTTQASLPSLTIQLQGTNVVVSWPQDAVTFVLETAALVGTGASWSAVPSNTIWSTNAGRISATAPALDPSAFFRLRLQP
jgi:hypothetical protein